MPTITVHGVNTFMSEESCRQRLQHLRSRASDLDRYDVDELAALEQWAARTAHVRSLALNPDARMAGADPLSGYGTAQASYRNGRTDAGATRTIPAGLLAEAGRDSLSGLVGRARRDVECKHATHGLPDRAAEMLDLALTTGPDDHRLTLAQYIEATGTDAYRAAFTRAPCLTANASSWRHRTSCGTPWRWPATGRWHWAHPPAGRRAPTRCRTSWTRP